NTDDRYGYSYDYETVGAAKKRALSDCNNNSAAGRACRVVATLNGQCGAIAYEREGVTGFGWGVASTKAAAQQKAIAKCRSSAPKGGLGCLAQGAFCDH
ncbi:MAG: DUF4189 domain-containing protein, partial [Hyphomicrobiales bacterium]|nr:DUF4189 domain-containing protein [Hyphomicrobiales bacterium]